jgi:pyruvate dehydrogenase E2 component (dihydrolipoamide acetyltransferase)
MSKKMDIVIPDIGGSKGIDVIEILVKKGDKIEKDTSLITLESDKASMEIPSPAAGIVDSIKLKVGDKVSEGDVILALLPDASEIVVEKKEVLAVETPITEEAVVAAAAVPPPSEEPAVVELMDDSTTSNDAYAGPAVRRLAFELGLSLCDLQGSGRKSRITKEDIQHYVKSRLREPAGNNGFSLPTAPQIDFSQFGETELKPLNKIKRLTAANLHRSWVTIPHVTQFDEADITSLEAFRKSEVEGAPQAPYKLTMLAFICKVVSKALVTFPQFNASLDASGENLIYKHYVNIGIAVETQNGLVVPVIKGVKSLSVVDIAKEMTRLSGKARDKTLMPSDMNAGCFTISSLGGVGGTAFTPIVNAPEVAILGVSRSSIKPVYCQETAQFKPRLMLPLSLSYDHRVIDGAEAARFTRFLADHLSDIRKVLL